ncbi:transcription factor E2F4-like isoform X2 [Ornithodoros turicata]|uniref:transcription factor E2F4-like isoform X2 n=1 Tax=Ornithodoros turicata TaxID=34597 RepID=UPI003138B522
MEEWGAGPGCNTRELSDRLAALQGELEKLDSIEKTLDQHKAWAQQSLRNITDDASNAARAYLATKALHSCFQGSASTLLSLRGPPDTVIRVPDLRQVNDKHYWLYAKSELGPINVLLLDKEPEDELPSENQQSSDATEPLGEDERATETVVAPSSSPKPDELEPMDTSSDGPLPKADDSTAKVNTPNTRRQSRQQAPVTRKSSGKQIVEKLKEVPAATEVPATRMTTRNSPRKTSQGSAGAPPSSQLVTRSQKAAAASNAKVTETSDQSLLLGSNIDTGHAILGKADAPKDLSAEEDIELKDMNFDYQDDFLETAPMSPFLCLSPPLSERDYFFNLDDTEGICDLYDIFPI